MDKVWFIQVEGKKEGPFNIKELKRDSRVTPDTLVWKRGFTSWVVARHVYELKELFEDDSQQEEEDISSDWKKKLPENEVLTIQTAPPNLTIWVIIVLLILAYFIYRLLRP
jgi:hypothetical protein